MNHSLYINWCHFKIQQNEALNVDSMNKNLFFIFKTNKITI